MTGRVPKARRAELLPVVVDAWNGEDRPSATEISRRLGLGRDGGLVRSLLAEAGIEPVRRLPRTAQHGDPSMWQTYRCRCDVCDTARRQYRREREYERLSASERRKALDSLAGTRAKLQARTAATARRRGARWTGPEMQLVARKDLTATEVARMTGRTFHAVSNVRAALRDPDHRDHARYQQILDGRLAP